MGRSRSTSLPTSGPLRAPWPFWRPSCWWWSLETVWTCLRIPNTLRAGFPSGGPMDGEKKWEIMGRRQKDSKPWTDVMGNFDPDRAVVPVLQSPTRRAKWFKKKLFVTVVLWDVAWVYQTWSMPKITGWWFPTFGLFSISYTGYSFPLTFIFFRGVGQPSTRLTCETWWESSGAVGAPFSDPEISYEKSWPPRFSTPPRC